MDESTIIGVVYLLYCIEYSLLLCYLIYNLQHNFSSRKWLSYLNLFCFFSILLCSLRLVVYILGYLNHSTLHQVILCTMIYALYFTVFSVLASCWDFKYTKYDFSLNDQSRARKQRQILIFLIISNVIYYIAGLVILILLIQGTLKSGESYISTWSTLSYNFTGTIIICSYLFVAGFRLLRMINTYSTLRPTKLVWNIYIILGMVCSYIPFYAATWAFYVVHDEDSTMVAMTFLNFFRIILAEVMPIVMFASNVKLLREYANDAIKGSFGKRNSVQDVNSLLIKTILEG